MNNHEIEIYMYCGTAVIRVVFSIRGFFSLSLTFLLSKSRLGQSRGGSLSRRRRKHHSPRHGRNELQLSHAQNAEIFQSLPPLRQIPRPAKGRSRILLCQSLGKRGHPGNSPASERRHHYGPEKEKTQTPGARHG